MVHKTRSILFAISLLGSSLVMAQGKTGLIVDAMKKPYPVIGVDATPVDGCMANISKLKIVGLDHVPGSTRIDYVRAKGGIAIGDATLVYDARDLYEHVSNAERNKPADVLKIGATVWAVVQVCGAGGGALSIDKVFSRPPL